MEQSENYLSCSWKIVCNFLSPRFPLFVNSLINNSNCYLIMSRNRIDLHVYGKNKRLLFTLAREWVVMVMTTVVARHHHKEDNSRTFLEGFSYQQQTIDEITSESQTRIGMSWKEFSRIHLIKLNAMLKKLLKLMLCINFFHYS